MIAASRLRRLLIALVAIAASATLFRGSLASALVTRGDDLMRSGATNSALVAYARAVAWDPRSAVAADRLAFALVLRRAPGDADRAYDVADVALHARSNDLSLHVDRAFAASRLARWRGAERDFAWAAREARDPRYAHLAARMAERAREPGRARQDLRLALGLDAGYLPARALLQSVAP